MVLESQLVGDLARKSEKVRIRPANVVTGRFDLRFRSLGKFRQVLGIRLLEYRNNGFKDLLHEVLLLGGQWRIARGVSADHDPCALCTSSSWWHRQMHAGKGDAKQ